MTIAKNAGFLLTSQAATWVLTLILMVFLPRYLGAEGMGHIYLANSIWGIIGVLIAFGMDTYLTKEISRAPEKTSALIMTSIAARIVLYVFGFAAVALYAQVANYETLSVIVIYIIGISQFILQFSFVSRAALQGVERMDYIALGDVASRIFGVVVTIALLLLGFGVIAAATVSIGSALVNVIIQFHYLRRIQDFKITFPFRSIGGILKASIPYLLVYAFFTIYQQLDVIIISLLVTGDEIGWYGGADQLTGTFLFIPTVLITAIFPTLNRLFAHASNSLYIVMQKSFNFLLIICIPLGLGIWVVADQLVVLLFGESFTNSGPVFAVRGIVLIFTSLNILFGQFLISTDRQYKWAWVMAAAAIATIPLDLILIPITKTYMGIGAVGASLSYLITEGGMVLYGFLVLRREMFTWKFVLLILRTVLAGLVMVAGTWFFRNMFIAIPIIIGAVIYLVSILIFQVIAPEDRVLIKQIVQKVIERFTSRQAKPVKMI